MICVECAAPVKFLYTYYSEDNIHATKCSNCGNFADKYIECDKTVTFIDLLLLRKAAVRHVVFNAAAKNAMEVFALPASRVTTPAPSTRSNSTDDIDPLESPPSRASSVFSNSYKPQTMHTSFVNSKDRIVAGISPAVLKLVAFVLMFDIYLLWAMSERSIAPSVLRFLNVTHPAIQYALFMALSICDTVLANLVVRYMAWYFIGWTDGGAITTSLLIGSFFKLLPILTLIWHYDIPFAEQVVRYFSLYCITEILSITLDCGYFYAGLFTFTSRSVSLLLNKLFWTLV